ALGLQAENLDPLDMPPGARDRLEALKSGMSRTRHLLDQLLALARQDLASPEVEETVHLEQIVKAVVADLLAEASERNVDLGFTMAEHVSVSADPVAMASVVRNLVENAVRYTPDGGRVDVGIYRESGQAVLQIEDSGPGVPPRDIERIFEPFYRGPKPSGDGSGLGLSIVKRIVARYGGSIEIENLTEPERSGLRATVKLPAAD
ncbi:HAMP domain-containing sensor histidine kinase, partial [Bradyrhizobium sp. 23]|uniref:sensor histidine kinase n=1 Tax=Bradyrhizobium sp. 23 TaxID=2782667 RepID=UPI001FFAF477